MKEQPLFAPGQKVICVDSSIHKNQASGNGKQLLIEGNTYVIKAIRRKKCCGAIVVHVGLKSNLYFTTCVCGFEEEKKDNNAWHNQNRFVPASFDKYAEETFHQSLKGKPVKRLITLL